MKATPCPACGADMTVKAQKNGKPWLGCSSCKVITLVHGPEGVKRFKDRTGWTAEGAPVAAPPAGGAPAPKVGEPAPKPAPGPVGHAARKAARRGQ